MLILLGLAFGTLVSEDASCIAAGLLIQRGSVDAAAGTLACATGIFLGDFALWVLGRLCGDALKRWPVVSRRLSSAAIGAAGAWLDRRAAAAIVSSRFLPGTRFALYVTAGILGLPGSVFAAWSLVAVLLWTPALVLLTARFGQTFAHRFSSVVGAGFVAAAITFVAVLALLRTVRALTDTGARIKLAAYVARWRRWEFWPAGLFYVPVSIYIGWLSLRHHGLSTITAANPGMPDGGIVGESKFDILERLPAEWTIPAFRIDPAEAATRVRQLKAECVARRWDLPIICKPDVGQRGAGVRLIASWQAARAYLSEVDAAVVVQRYHPGPFEAGIFYYRFPGSACGRILSLTDKRFPVLVGDGVSTIEALIWRHPRFRMQAVTFATRHAGALDRVLASGERFPLAVAGNHCQGTLFRDGGHLVTAALERRVDAIAQAYPGFFVGRFDVRYSHVDEFRAGRDLAIVELNGVTSESTNIYDPDTRLWAAYRQLFRQWKIIFTIGAANRDRGATTSSWRRLLNLARTHLTTAVALSD